MPCILAIETSCDETAVAIVRDRVVESNIVASQIDLHRQYGGVVPEVASRAHLETVNLGVDRALEAAGVGWEAIDGVAATAAPGLVGALLVGLTAAKTLAIVRHKPLIGVHHLEGHIYAAYLSEPELQPPFLCLLVSGGHTSTIAVRDCGEYQTLGSTRDDAAGEAFDKVARLLGLGYPGGPAIDKWARSGNPAAFALPEGKVSRPGGGYEPYDFSFSGLKTAVGRLVASLATKGSSETNTSPPNSAIEGRQSRPSGRPNEVIAAPGGKIRENHDRERLNDSLPIADLAASFQDTVARTLTRRTLACASEYGLETIVVGGGVAANSGLRSHLQAGASERGLRVIFPPMKYCTDNAAMIGCAAAEHLARGHVSPLTLGARSRLPLTDAMKLYCAEPEGRS